MIKDGKQLGRRVEGLVIALFFTKKNLGRREVVNKSQVNVKDKLLGGRRFTQQQAYRYCPRSRPFVAVSIVFFFTFSSKWPSPPRFNCVPIRRP